MAFFDDIGKKLSQTGQGIAQKTKDTTEIIKLNGQISDEEKRIREITFRIGQLYLAQHMEDAEPAIAPSVAEVKEAQAKIADYTEQIKRLRGFTPCPACGASVASTAAFCNNCGTAVAAQQEKGQGGFCTGCGAPVAPGSAFCTACGTRVEAQSTPAPAETPAQGVCPSCGATLEPDAAFCTSCGTRIG